MSFVEGLILMIGTIMGMMTAVSGLLWRAAAAFTRLRTATEDVASDLAEHTRTEELLRREDRAAVNAKLEELARQVQLLQIELARQAGERNGR